jgi:hypothetical protein
MISHHRHHSILFGTRLKLEDLLDPPNTRERVFTLPGADKKPSY